MKGTLIGKGELLNYLEDMYDIPKISARKDRFSFMLLNIFRVNPFDLKELRNLFPKTKHDKTLFTEAFHKRNVFSL